MKTIAQQISALKSATESLSNFKNDSSNRGQEIYKDYQNRIPVMIEELRALGVNEVTHPKFKEAVVEFNYWK